MHFPPAQLKVYPENVVTFGPMPCAGGVPWRAGHMRRAIRDHDADTGGWRGRLLVLGYWVGVRRPFHLSLFLTVPRMVLPQDPSTNVCAALNSANHLGSFPCAGG